MSQFAEALAALAQALKDEGIRWYVFGAQAVMVYGRPRLTTDIYVTVELELDHAPAFATRLEKHGFASRASNIEDVVARTRVLPLVHEKSGFPVDLVIAGPGLEAQFLANAKTVDLGGVEVPVIDPTDLVIAKVLAGRPRDMEDVRGILFEQGTGGTLDLDHAREILGILEQALDRRDLVSELARLLKT